MVTYVSVFCLYFNEYHYRKCNFKILDHILIYSFEMVIVILTNDTSESLRNVTLRLDEDSLVLYKIVH